MTEQRKYSVAEIDRMRNAVASSFHGHHSFETAAFWRIVEERLRTHMLNGTDPDELEAAGKEAELAYRAKVAAAAAEEAQMREAIERRWRDHR